MKQRPKIHLFWEQATTWHNNPHHNKCHRRINQKINQSQLLGRTPQLQSHLQRPHNYQVQRCKTEHHQDMQHKEIPTRRNMVQTNSSTGHITLRLCKLNASRTAIIKYQNYAKGQNTAPRLILRTNAKESTKECLKTLYWLPIKQRIDYKICTLFHKCHTWQAPVYLQNLIQEKTTNCPGLR